MTILSMHLDHLPAPTTISDPLSSPQIRIYSSTTPLYTFMALILLGNPMSLFPDEYILHI